MAWFKKAPATCATCPFAVAIDTSLLTDFACRFMPPVPAWDGQVAMATHARVGRDHWCGQHPERRIA